MPIGLETAQDYHPTELTRQASPETPLLKGDFTLDELKAQFGTPEMTEEAVLAAAGNLGHAFFKVGDIYRSFAPAKGETAIMSSSQESGVVIAPITENDGNDDEDSEVTIASINENDEDDANDDNVDDEDLLEAPDDEDENDELDF
jgi:hypothetical protein